MLVHMCENDTHVHQSSKMTGLGLVTYCALESAVDFTIYLLLLFSYPIIPKLILYHGAQ